MFLVRWVGIALDSRSLPLARSGHRLAVASPSTVDATSLRRSIPNVRPAVAGLPDIKETDRSQSLFGALGGDRTHDHELKRLLLYP